MLNGVAQHRIWCWQNGPSKGSYHQIMAKTSHGKKKKLQKSCRSSRTRGKKNLKKETPVTFPVNKADQKNPPILISPSVPNSPMPGIARRPRPSPSSTWRGAVTRLRLPESGHSFLSCSKFWMQMKVSWLLQRRNQVDDANKSHESS